MLHETTLPVAARLHGMHHTGAFAPAIWANRLIPPVARRSQRLAHARKLRYFFTQKGKSEQYSLLSDLVPVAREQAMVRLRAACG